MDTAGGYDATGQKDTTSTEIYSTSLRHRLKNETFSRVMFMEDHIPVRPDSSLLFVRQTSKWSGMWCSTKIASLKG